VDLLPDDVRAALRQFPPLAQDGLGDAAKVIVTYFFPAGRYAFYVTEAVFLEDGDVLFYGYCLSPFDATCDEWGSTTLSELQRVRHLGLSIERDLHFPVATLTLRDALARRQGGPTPAPNAATD